MSSATAIKELSDEQLQQWLQDRHYPAWRGRQIKHWLYQKWVPEFAAMHSLPETLRQQLAASFVCSSVSCKADWTSRDASRKYLLRLTDGEMVETVLIPAGNRQTVCVSTQVGCPVGCSFCATGRQGFVRDLRSSEIVDQVVFCCHRLGRRVTNVVLMGMGEPLLNFSSVVSALDLMGAPDALGLSVRHLTVSTCGIPDKIRRLAELGRQWNLSWSLHAGDDATRATMIPPAYRYPIHEILEACRYYQHQTGRRVTLEYALLENRNTGEEDARKVARLARNIGAKVNLIPYNPSGSPHRPVSGGIVKRFVRILESSGVTVTVRHSRGEDILAACGQLRGHSRFSEKTPDRFNQA